METVDIAAEFHESGFVLVRNVFDPAELARLAEHVFHLRRPSDADFAKYGAEPFRLQGKASLADMSPEELRKCERIMRLHLFDSGCRELMLDKRVFSFMSTLWPSGALAGHVMYYPKPPGSRGFALHTDIAYLPVDPPDFAGCMIAVDDADEGNGALSVVPGSHRITDFSKRTIPTDEFLFPEEFALPAGKQAVLVPMKAGDVLLFHGGALHGSMPNRSPDRWRRAFVCHYFGANVRAIPKHFKPALNAAGEEVAIPR